MILTFYGDDFTGSTDAMEALAANGIETVLFLDAPLDVPDDKRLSRFPNCEAVGIAGNSRSKSPQWMTENLPAVFARLRDLGAPICHYKVCSTFDSSPEVGSIGRAIEIGREVFDSPYVPVVVGAPSLRRYCLFGNLFAAGGEETYRLDRHPTMSRHPSTPMDESDLRVHLARQTSKRIELFDILELRRGDARERFRKLLAWRPDIVLFDGFDEDSLRAAGGLIWSSRTATPMFAAGSSGFEYALVAHWRASGELPAAPVFPNPLKAEKIIVVSGSCSPITEKQIRWAMQRGFEALPAMGDRAPERAEERAAEALDRGKSVILYTALGAVTPRDADFNERLGVRLGGMLRELLRASKVRRIVICGGDTSSRAGRQLGLYALTMLAPLAPGAPLCRGWSDDPELDGLEAVFKGGQVGRDDFFQLALEGGNE
ncbi:MAG: four-carbon acid sugar kinase family protein [Bryobacteraceae bacterium]